MIIHKYADELRIRGWQQSVGYTRPWNRVQVNRAAPRLSVWHSRAWYDTRSKLLQIMQKKTP